MHNYLAVGLLIFQCTATFDVRSYESSKICQLILLYLLFLRHLYVTRALIGTMVASDVVMNVSVLEEKNASI